MSTSLSTTEKIGSSIGFALGIIGSIYWCKLTCKNSPNIIDQYMGSGFILGSLPILTGISGFAIASYFATQRK